MEASFLSALLSIIIINLVLSGDNAVVIALATLRLEAKQRKRAIFWGTFGAVALRIALTAVAAILLTIPYIQAIGGILLTWIAVKLLEEEEDLEDKQAPASMREAIKTIIIADLLMSLDNVLAVAGASGGNIILLVFGLLLSIPLVVWGSTLISSLMRKWPWLVSLGAGLIGWTAGEMLLKEPYLKVIAENPIFEYLIPGVVAGGVILIGNLRKIKSKKQTGNEDNAETKTKNASV